MHPAHRTAEQVGSGEYLGAAAAHGFEFEYLRERGQHGQPAPPGTRSSLRHVMHHAKCLPSCRPAARPPSATLDRMGELHDRHRRVIPNWVGLYYDQPLEIVRSEEHTSELQS